MRHAIMLMAIYNLLAKGKQTQDKQQKPTPVATRLNYRPKLRVYFFALFSFSSS